MQVTSLVRGVACYEARLGTCGTSGPLVMGGHSFARTFSHRRPGRFMRNRYCVGPRALRRDCLIQLFNLR